MLLKLSVIRENEINYKAFCYTWAVLRLIGSNLFIQRDLSACLFAVLTITVMQLRVIADIKHQNVEAIL